VSGGEWTCLKLVVDVKVGVEDKREICLARYDRADPDVREVMHCPERRAEVIGRLKQHVRRRVHQVHPDLPADQIGRRLDAVTRIRESLRAEVYTRLPESPFGHGHAQLI